MSGRLYVYRYCQLMSHAFSHDVIINIVLTVYFFLTSAVSSRCQLTMLADAVSRQNHN